MIEIYFTNINGNDLYFYSYFEYDPYNLIIWQHQFHDFIQPTINTCIY